MDSDCEFWEMCGDYWELMSLFCSCSEMMDLYCVAVDFERNVEKEERISVCVVYVRDTHR